MLLYLRFTVSQSCAVALSSEHLTGYFTSTFMDSLEPYWNHSTILLSEAPFINWWMTLCLTFRLVGLKGNLLDIIVRRFLRDMKSELFMRRLSAIRTIADFRDSRPVVVLGVLTAMGDENVRNLSWDCVHLGQKKSKPRNTFDGVRIRGVLVHVQDFPKLFQNNVGHHLVSSLWFGRKHEPIENE